MISSNPTLYHWLTVVDALRVGRARERQIAKKYFDDELISGVNSNA
jgi:hypothetical protein